MKQNAYYDGPASRYQVINGKKERPLDSSVVKYSKYQLFLYRRALHGLSIYNPDIIAKLTAEEKTKIQQVKKRANMELNIYKQHKMIKLSNGILQNIFKHDLGPANSLLSPSCCKLDRFYKVNLTNEQLDITRDDIIDLFVSKRILPKNFHELNLK